MFFRHIALTVYSRKFISGDLLTKLIPNTYFIKVTVFKRYWKCWNVFFITRNV